MVPEALVKVLNLPRSLSTDGTRVWSDLRKLGWICDVSSLRLVYPIDGVLMNFSHFSLTNRTSALVRFFNLLSFADARRC